MEITVSIDLGRKSKHQTVRMIANWFAHQTVYT